jgi:hypothetical protein
MKKLLLAACPLMFGAALSAQSFSIVDGASNPVANGSTIIYFVDVATSVETHDFVVTNTSPNSVTCKVRKAIQTSQAGQTFYFCTDLNCYAPSTSLSLAVTEATGGSFQLLTDFTPASMVGVSTVRYSVFNTANPSDSTYFNIEYHVSPTGIAAHSMVKANIGSPMPNPASSVFNMNYNLGSSFGAGTAKLVVYNMLGDVVKSENLSEAEGTFRMDVSTLDNGVYFTSLEVDGKQLSTKRLVVTH